MWRSLLMSNCQAFALFTADDGSCPKSVFVSFHSFLFSWLSGTKSLWNTTCDVSTVHLPDDRWMDGWMNVGLRSNGILHKSPSQCHFENHKPLWGLRSVPGQFMWDLWMDKVAPWKVFLWILRFPSISITPPVLHTHSFIYRRRQILFEGAVA